ncbi:mycoredoxin [Sphaerisporangium sp. NPDC051017]|uniref:mycoredoxin n=1 Tax=unclassified Sphaerisporangium TaxID=2630420 RepID=UPI0033F28318
MALKVYTTSWCGPCKRLKSQLTREGIAFQEINIETDPSAARFVESVNGGNQLVPTVVLEDGTALANPSVIQLKGLLSGSGA